MIKNALKKSTLARILHSYNYIYKEGSVTQNLNRFETHRISRNISQQKRQKALSDW